ncbi:MAG: PAS domain S-box protein, partial [Anaerolineales bacterium]|nr:PAS domain S-box protein [Anaerolineales bacterium]
MLNLRSLPARLVLGFVALVIITALAVGIPAILILRAQLDVQAQSQITQGQRSTQALLAAQQKDLTNLALLTAQRPTLRQLMGESSETLTPYLETLRTGADLTLIALCASDGTLTASAGPLAPDLCTTPETTRFQPAPETTLWLLASHPLDDPTQGFVVVGLRLDDAFAATLRDQTGLDQIFLVDGQIAAATFPVATLVEFVLPPSGTSAFTLNGEPYLFVRTSLTAGAENLVAFPITSIIETRRQLTQLILITMSGIALASTFVGVLLAQGISRPLSALRAAAATLRKGDLAAPIHVPTHVPEVSIVASALEDSRVALQHTLGELRRERDWIEHLLESIVEGVVTLDPRGHITYFSRGAERITGWAQADTLGRLCDEIFHPADGRKFSECIPAPDRQQKVTLTLHDGHQATLAITGARLAPPVASSARVALVLRDVTEEDAMRHLLGDFLANITHEFRTPLTTILSASELLRTYDGRFSDKERIEILDDIRSAVGRMTLMLDQVLTISRSDAGRLEFRPEPVSVAGFARDLLGKLEKAALGSHRFV